MLLVSYVTRIKALASFESNNVLDILRKTFFESFCMQNNKIEVILNVVATKAVITSYIA